MRTILLYSLLVVVPVLGLAALLHIGGRIEIPIHGDGSTRAIGQNDMPFGVPILLAQVVVILLLARSVGMIFRLIHQPQVMGEMVAGILLGPSLLGWMTPRASAFLFPPASLGFLTSLSQVGLLLYMFLVGLRLDRDKLTRHRHVFVLTSHTSIVFPFTLGVLLALYLYPRLSDQGATFVQFALFVGTAMSMTAFPVLARILTDFKLLRTPVGNVAIACAAVDDVTAWCILAAVVLFVRTATVTASLWTTVLGAVIYTAIMVSAVRLALRRIESKLLIRGRVSDDLLALIILMVFVSACITDLLGIHALFGGFLVGAIFPRNPELVEALRSKIEGMTVTLFLPLFFALTGLRTSISLVRGGGMWFYCSLIIAAAIVGKFGGSTISARLNGMTWREAGTIGVLMNTRGLMELVVLNIGLDIGVISPSLFAMMVLMALITTFMATPLLEWLYPPARVRAKLAATIETAF